MKYTIKGMTCGACKQIIDMDLEDHGFGTCRVDLNTETLIVPEEHHDNLENIIAVIEESGKYIVISK